MKTITIPGFIHVSIPESWNFGNASTVEGVKYDFWTMESMGPKFTMVCPYEMMFEIPETFDAVEGFVASLKEQKRELMAEHRNAITEIDRKISQLLAITNEVTQ